MILRNPATGTRVCFMAVDKNFVSFSMNEKCYQDSQDALSRINHQYHGFNGVDRKLHGVG